MNLNGVNLGVKMSLTAHLRVASTFISDNNPSNDFIACRVMKTFVASVNTFEDRGRLTEDELLQQAQVINDAIGCSTSSSAAADITGSSRPLPHFSINTEDTNIPSDMSLPH